MKKSLYFLPVMLLAMGASAQAQGDNSNRPCFDVNVQINPDNKANVKQKCGSNYSRTMQAGSNNEATTQQKGKVNDNAVHQYEYNAAPRPNQSRTRKSSGE